MTTSGLNWSPSSMVEEKMSLMDQIYARIDNPDDAEVFIDENESEIRRFYSGQTVFVTGGTGYMGKAVVEKLLRGCPDLKKLYILVRPKKQWSVEQRMKRYFENVLFDKLWKTSQGWRDKVIPIIGDCSLEGLGISEEDRRILVEEASVIFHVAATIKFDEQLSLALKINVLATREIIYLARNCRNLKALLHVSTAYSNCYMFKTEEKFYPPPIDVEVVLDLIRADGSTEISSETKKMFLGNWPNTYCFTKAIAENLVKEYGKGLPIGVFRPSIVLSAYQEPLASWSSSLNGPTATFAASAAGLVHGMYINLDNIADLIPVDMCANGMLATAWDVANNVGKADDPKIYHYTTSTTNPITWRGLWEVSVPFAYDYPPLKAVWLYSVYEGTNYAVFLLVNFFAHFIPAALTDLYLLVSGKETMALAIYFKIQKYFSVVTYFTLNEWRFDAEQSCALWDRMTEADHKLFFCDLRKLSWKQFGVSYWRGIRVYNLRDPMDTVEEARGRLPLLYALHYTLLSVVIFVAAYLLYKMIHLFVQFTCS